MINAKETTMAETTDMTPKNEKMPAAGIDSSKARAFNAVLLQLADGDAHEQLSQDLQKLVRTIGVRARQTPGKPVNGSLTLTIKITGDHKDVLDVGYDIKLDEPKPRRERSVFWADKNGNMTEKNPRQTELPMGSKLRDVSSKAEQREAEENDENRDA